MRSSMKVTGIGIDLVDISRIRRFLQDNRPSIGRLFSESEKTSLKLKNISPLKFAQFFSAKEAFFKAAGGSWMGLEGFSNIEVKCLSRDRFKVSSFAGKQIEGRAEGNFLRGRGWIGARLVLWNSK